MRAENKRPPYLQIGKGILEEHVPFNHICRIKSHLLALYEAGSYELGADGVVETTSRPEVWNARARGNTGTSEYVHGLAWGSLAEVKAGGLPESPDKQTTSYADTCRYFQNCRDPGNRKPKPLQVELQASERRNAATRVRSEAQRLWSSERLSASAQLKSKNCMKPAARKQHNYSKHGKKADDRQLTVTFCDRKTAS